MPSLVEIKEILRTHNLRITTPRIAVLEVLHGGDGHYSAEEIHEAILRRYPTINMATVYRTLELLEVLGLVARMEASDRPTSWEWSGSAHHHLICRSCGYIIELNDEPFQTLASELLRTRGVQVDLRHLTLHGLCTVCAAESGDQESFGP